MSFSTKQIRVYLFTFRKQSYTNLYTCLRTRTRPMITACVRVCYESIQNCLQKIA